jgi:hypothetical protein
MRIKVPANAGLHLLALSSVWGQCAADPKWLPKTPPPRIDSPFYQAAWQHFLFANQPDENGNPPFISYRNIQ